MQVTLELPESLAARLPRKPDELADVIARGLRPLWAATEGIGGEVLGFFASGPTAREIIEYKPSAELAERSRILLEKNARGDLTDEEAGMLGELAQLDSLMSLIKAEARKRLAKAA